MSVQTQIDRIIELVNESHEKARAKGGTTTTPLLANLPNVIDSIPEPVAETWVLTLEDGSTVTKAVYVG